VNISTVKTAHASLKGDVLVLSELRRLVAECDEAGVPDAARVVLSPVGGAHNAQITWTSNVTRAPEVAAVVS